MFCVFQEAVQTDKVEAIVISVGTQRRAVLEAIAFGSFLRDVETHVDAEYQLLTPISSFGGSGPGFDGPAGPGSDSGGGSGGGGGGGGGGGNVPAAR